MTQHTPGPLRVIMRGPDHDAIITEAGDILANVNRQRRETTVSRNATEIVRRYNAHEVMLEALRGVIGYLGEGSEHPDPCSSNPTWLSGADVEGPCDCYVGRVVAAIHAAEGRADLGVEPVERPVCTCPFASEGYLSKNCALHAAEAEDLKGGRK